VVKYLGGAGHDDGNNQPILLCYPGKLESPIVRDIMDVVRINTRLGGLIFVGAASDEAWSLLVLT
jgi:hypothetical protein